MGKAFVRPDLDAAKRIGRLATRCLLREAAAAPKPGLVDRFGPGAHGDMDFMTFADSALALERTFAACARAGRAAGPAALRGGQWPGATLEELRRIGLDGERRMLEATGGANTHRGAIFLLGLLCAAAGALDAAGFRGPGAGRRARGAAAGIAAGLRSLAPETCAPASNGDSACAAFGVRGIRGEAEAGLPSLDGGALRVLERASAEGPPGDGACVVALMCAMTRAEDTVALHRGGMKGLLTARRSALVALALGGTATEEGRAWLAAMSEDFAARRLSPGGSADLLAAGLLVVAIEDDFARKEAPWTLALKRKPATQKKSQNSSGRRTICAASSSGRASRETPGSTGC